MKRFGFVVAMSMLSGVLAAAPAIGKEITFIHTSDTHGDMNSHYNARSDSNGLKEGGLARMYTKIKQIRDEEENSVYIHTGDTIQGGATSMFTRGQAMVDVMNLMKVDVFAPGNWEFVYGVPRFLELFGGSNPLAPWNTIAANAYYTGQAPFTDKAPGERLVPPYVVKKIGGIKVGFMGFTTNRGPQVVGSKVTQGVVFSAGEGITLPNGTVIPPEVPELISTLRNVEGVDLVVMLSELGLAGNLRLAEKYPGIDIVFSSDMHEETNVAVVASTGTILVEEGEDGAQVGELEIEFKDGRISEWKWTAHDIDERIREDKRIARKIEEVEHPFHAGPDFVPGRFVNPFNGTKLMQPLDTVVGYTTIPLSRNNFSHEDMPAVIEGSGHDFLTDAFRAMTGAQIGAIRGFRYNNSIAPGPITLDDLYHWMPIGPQIAIANIKAQQLNNQIENSADGSLNADVSKWTGGWLFNFSNVTMDINPNKGKALTPISAGRASNIKVGGVPVLDSAPGKLFSYASYWYANDPNLVNVVPIPDPSTIRVLTRDGLVPPAAVTADNAMDATEVVAGYLASLPNMTVTADNLVTHRMNLVRPLPAPLFGFPEIQPLKGVPVTE